MCSTPVIDASHTKLSEKEKQRSFLSDQSPKSLELVIQSVTKNYPGHHFKTDSQNRRQYLGILEESDCNLLIKGT